MLGKLFKYDMKSISRELIPIWILGPVVSLLLGLSTRRGVSQNSPYIGGVFSYNFGGEDILEVILVLVFFAIMVAMFVMTLLFVIQRFWKGLLKEEGYLMFTLPVEPWELIVSKGLSATLVSCISSLAALLSIAILIFSASGAVLLDFIRYWNLFWEQAWLQLGGMLPVVIGLVILNMIVSAVQSVFNIYAAMALGQLFQGHRVLGACVSYLGMSIVISVITNILMAILNLASPDWIYDVVFSGMVRGSIVTLVFSLLLGIVQVIIFYVITERVLATKLNLE